MMPLASASVSCDADSIANGTNAFIISRQLKQLQHDCFNHARLLASALGTCDDDGIVHGTTVLPRSR